MTISELKEQLEFLCYDSDESSRETCDKLIEGIVNVFEMLERNNENVRTLLDLHQHL